MTLEEDNLLGEAKIMFFKILRNTHDFSIQELLPKLKVQKKRSFEAEPNLLLILYVDVTFPTIPVFAISLLLYNTQI